MTAATIPDLGASVIWRAAAYKVKDRTRHKSSGAVTLWLCDCNKEECPCKHRATLEQINIPEEVEQYIAAELAIVLQRCPTYQEVLLSSSGFTESQKAAAWQLLSNAHRKRIKEFKKVFEKFLIRTDVRHNDPYYVAYNHHGKVEEVKGTEVLVRWAERKGKPVECERYEYTELEVRNVRSP